MGLKVSRRGGTRGMKLKSAQHKARRTGRAEMDEHASPVNAGEYILSMNPESRRHRENILKQLLDELSDESPLRIRLATELEELRKLSEKKQ